MTTVSYETRALQAEAELARHQEAACRDTHAYLANLETLQAAFEHAEKQATAAEAHRDAALAQARVLRETLDRIREWQQTGWQLILDGIADNLLAALAPSLPSGDGHGRADQDSMDRSHLQPMDRVSEG